METDSEVTEVIFRKVKIGDFKGTIEAFFPYVINDIQGNVVCYTHTGQHGGASWDYFLFGTIPAKENEYKELKSELEDYYGNLKIVKKRNYKRFLYELNKLRTVNTYYHESTRF